MLIVFLKFGEVATRAIFVVLTSYLLPLEQAGQFGLVVTLQGITSLAFGYERYIDIQRRMVDQSPADFDRAVENALKLFAVNYIWLTPIYAALLVWFADLPVWLVPVSIILAIAEQLMNKGYQMSMVNRRYLPFLWAAVGKNIGIIVALGVVMLQNGGNIDLTLVLTTWGAWSGLIFFVAAVVWLRVRQPSTQTNPPLKEILSTQIRASWNHFLLGLTAILILQIDRLTIGAFMPLEQVGVYFRHILMVSLIYQVFNIAFFNRIVPVVYSTARTAPVSVLRAILAREYIHVMGFVAALIFGGLVVHYGTGGVIAERFELEPTYFFGLLIASTVRMRADLNSLIFNALHREKTIFRLQLLALVLSFPILAVLTVNYGIPGAIIAGAIGATFYLVPSTLTILIMPEDAYHDR